MRGGFTPQPIIEGRAPRLTTRREPAIHAPPMLTRYSDARLPTPHGEFRVVVYRTGQPAEAGATAVGLGHEEHVAMVMGDVRGPGVLCRVHSSCFTGEVMASLRCDCRAQ